jgi:acyl-CoA synthetase (AMP-forming)/AMP-acid ligase II
VAASTVTIPDRYNVSLLLDGNLEAGRGDKVAIYTADENLTYAELYARACRYGSALRELGASRGSRVIVVVDDHPDMPALFLGAIRAGLVPVPVNPFAHEEEYEFFARDSEAALIVLDPVRAEKALPFVERVVDRSRVVSAGGEFEGLTSIATAASGRPDDIPPYDSHRDDVAF